MKSHHIRNPYRRWIQQNLFNSLWDSFLTLLILAGVLAVLFQLWHFLSTEADWQVVLSNVHLLTLGSYPVDQVWRVLFNTVLFMGLLGATVATQTIMRRKSWAVFAGFVVVGVLCLWLYPLDTQGLNAANPGFLLVGLGLYAFGYFVQMRTQARFRWLALGWAVYFTLGFMVLSGFQGSDWLPDVPTDKWGGFLLTVLVALVGIGASLPLGVLLALGRRSQLPIIRYFCIGVIEAVRGVPMITILFMGQALIPLFLPPSLTVSNLMRIMIAVTIFAAAYMAEYVRGGLQAIPKGQTEAAQALGLSGWQTTLLIILPQALRAVIPGLVGECITLFKDTSLVTIVGLLDLTGAARAAAAQPAFIGRDVEIFMTIALVYWLLSFLMSRYSQSIEKRLGVGSR